MTWSPRLDRHLHAGDDRFLADIEVAEAADIAHAVELPRLLLESADEQHQAISVEFLLALRPGCRQSSTRIRSVGRAASRRASSSQRLAAPGDEAWAGHVVCSFDSFPLRKG